MEKIQNRKIITHYFNYEKRKSKIEKKKKIPTDFAFFSFFLKKVIKYKSWKLNLQRPLGIYFSTIKTDNNKSSPRKNINP